MFMPNSPRPPRGIAKSDCRGLVNEMSSPMYAWEEYHSAPNERPCTAINGARNSFYFLAMNGRLPGRTNSTALRPSFAKTEVFISAAQTFRRSSTNCRRDYIPYIKDQLCGSGFAVTFHSPLNAGTRVRQVVAVHCRPHGKPRIERQKPRLRDRRQLRGIFHVENNVTRPFA